MSSHSVQLDQLQTAFQQLSSLKTNLERLSNEVESGFQQLLKLSAREMPGSQPAPAIPASSVNESVRAGADILDMLRQLQDVTPSPSDKALASPATSVPTRQVVATDPAPVRAQDLVNRDAVASAKADAGRSLNGLRLYTADPQSHAWQMTNIHDDKLRSRLNELPLSRDSLLDILSQEDPHRAIAGIYQRMGTYSTLEDHGKHGAKLLTIRDSEGNALKALNIGSWTAETAVRVKTALLDYGVEMPSNRSDADPIALLPHLNQAPSAGQFIESPAAQLARYGFRTDPLNGKVVGGGSTSAIAYYQATGRMPPAEEVWK